jgi:hypothetical protein
MKTTAQRQRIVALCLALGLGVLPAGCGRSSGVVRLPVRGTVVGVGGEKLTGSITFVPAEGRSGPAATTTLVDGQYQFDLESGPTAGRHRVIVSRASAKAAMPPSGSTKLSPASQEAPGTKGLKTEWTLSVDVPTAKPYQCDFKLD